MKPPFTLHQAAPDDPIAHSWRDLSGFNNHEFLIALNDQTSGLQAYIAVHSRALGLAHGGTRFKAYDSQDEAVNDALNLSRAMSYKSALADLPYGGAKAVIIAVPGTDKQAVLKAYAEKVAALQGLFHTGTDVGLIDADISYMAQYCPYMLGVTPGNKQVYSTAIAAAQGVFYAIKASHNYKYGTDQLTGKTIGVKGLGKLGGTLVDYLVKDGAHVLIADIDAQLATRVHQQYPQATTVVSPTEIHRQAMDIYAPCALGNEITSDTIGDLQVQLIAGGANNQLASEELGDELFKKGILYAPDYVANAGGLIFVSEELEADGFHIERVKQRLAAIPSTLQAIFEQSEQQRLPTNRVAAHMAEAKIKGVHA